MSVHIQTWSHSDAHTRRRATLQGANGVDPATAPYTEAFPKKPPFGTERNDPAVAGSRRVRTKVRVERHDQRHARGLFRIEGSANPYLSRHPQAGPSARTSELRLADISHHATKAQGTHYRKNANVDVESTLRISAIEGIAPIEQIGRDTELILFATSEGSSQILQRCSSVYSGNQCLNEGDAHLTYR